MGVITIPAEAIVTAAQRAGEVAAAARVAAFPPLPPEKFHAILNVTGHRQNVEAVLEAMSDPENEKRTIRCSSAVSRQHQWHRFELVM